MYRILIAGCGYVGAALGSLLAGEGHAVWGLRRRTELLPSEISPVRANLAEPESLARLPDRLDFIFYTAAADQTTDEAYRMAYGGGMKNLIEVLQHQRQQPRRLFFTSSTAVYAQDQGEWVDEDSPTRPAHFSGKRLLEGESVLLSSPFPATVFRLAGIYGPGRTRLIEWVRRGEAAYREDRPVYTNRIHRDDCARALHHLMLLEKPETLYLGVDDEPAPKEEVLRWLAARLGVPVPKADPVAAGRTTGNKRCRNQRLLATGFLFRYPTFREGYTAILEELNGEKALSSSRL